MTRILLLGVDPETVDFSDPALPPGMTVEKVRAGIEVALKQFSDRGWGFRRRFHPPRRNCRTDGGASVAFDKLRLCGHWRRCAPAAAEPRIIRTRHQRHSKGRPE